MKKILLAFAITLAPFTVVFAAWEDTISGYDCLEVHRFFVDREDFSSYKMERVAEIPDETLGSVQHMIVGEVTRSKTFKSVKKTDLCEGRTLLLGGNVTDFKKGNRAARIGIGFGAGKQKLEVQTYLKDKDTGEIVASKKVVDRKFGGLAGGDEAKGLRDFAEKIVKFVKTGR